MQQKLQNTESGSGYNEPSDNAQGSIDTIDQNASFSDRKRTSPHKYLICYTVIDTIFLLLHQQSYNTTSPLAIPISYSRG